jgi:uncharacterized membrane protein YfcA
MSLFITILLLIAIGMTAGFLGGLFGVGGGVVSVPLLLMVFHRLELPAAELMRIAVATSLAVMVVNSAFAIYSHHKKEKIDFDLVMSLLPGMILGVVLGSAFSQSIPMFYLHILFGLLLSAIGVRMILLIKPKPDKVLPQWPLRSVYALFVGLTSGLLGIGGGTILVPFLVSRNVSMRETTACASVGTWVISVVGTISYLYLAQAQAIHLKHCTGFIYWPGFFSIAGVSSFFTLLGVKWAYRLPTHILTRIFGIFLLSMAVRILMGGVS